MDFKITKPTHFFAFLLLLSTFFIVLILPILSYSDTSPSTNITTQFSGFTRVIFEIILVVFSLLLVFFFMIIVPFLWYFLVNHLYFRQILQRINIRFEKIDKMIFFGVIAAAVALALSFAIELVLIALGVDLSNASNIPLLENFLSVPALIVIVTIQPVAEEIFFRGFLLEKIQGFAGGPIAVISTSVLFGIAHLSYGMMYTSFMAMVIGLVFGYVTYKTKNLYTSITAHILLNVVSITIYFFGKSLGL